MQVNYKGNFIRKEEFQNLLDLLESFARELKTRKILSQLAEAELLTRALLSFNEYNSDLFVEWFIDSICSMLKEGLIWTAERLMEFLPKFQSNVILPFLNKYWEKSEPDLAESPVSLEVFEGSLVRWYSSIDRVWGLVYLMQHSDLGGLDVDKALEEPTFLETFVPGMIQQFVKRRVPEIYAKKLECVSNFLPIAIPINYWCPKCHPYKDLMDDEWVYIDRHSPTPLKDYHNCPACGDMWKILRKHCDEWRGL